MMLSLVLISFIIPTIFSQSGPTCPVNVTLFPPLTCPDNYGCCKAPATLVCSDSSPPCTSCPDCCHSYLNATQCITCHATQCAGHSVIGDQGCNTTHSPTWEAYNEACCGRGVSKPASTLLPNCLLLGDSVTHGQSSFVIDALKDECQVQIFIGNDAGGESACWGVARAFAGTGELIDFDVIHFNEGLHSLYPRVNTTDESGVVWAETLANWTRVLALSLPTTTGTAATVPPPSPPSLIYATMTPMMAQRYCNPPGIPAHNVEALNALAVKTVSSLGIPINDLYTVITDFCGTSYVNCSICDNEAQYQCPAYKNAGGICGFHYTATGFEMLANSTVASIRAALKLRKSTASSSLIHTTTTINPPHSFYDFTTMTTLPQDWTLSNDCEHCKKTARNECNQFLPNATSFSSLAGMTHTTQRIDSSTSTCGANASSGHAIWSPFVLYGSFTTIARWFPGPEASVKSATGFIGLDSAANEGSITMGFHGEGSPQTGTGKNGFQLGSYRNISRSHHQQIINTTEDLSTTFNTFHVLWTPTSVTWSLNNRVVYVMDKLDDVPNERMQLRLDSRSGWIDQFDKGTSFQASFQSFEYTPPVVAAAGV